MTQEELNRILEKHKKWLNDETGGISANLRYADLKGTNLSDADLRYANLRYADLKGTNLSDADLRYANLSDADLRGTNLSDADLRYADLSDADLSGANLRYADLKGTNLSDADLKGTNLRYADLSDANGNNKEVKSLQLGKYTTTILVNVRITIGCQNHTIQEWENFTDEEISKMDDGALEWWKKWKEVILKVAKGE